MGRASVSLKTELLLFEEKQGLRWLFAAGKKQKKGMMWAQGRVGAGEMQPRSRCAEKRCVQAKHWASLGTAGRATSTRAAWAVSRVINSWIHRLLRKIQGLNCREIASLQILKEWVEWLEDKRGGEFSFLLFPSGHCPCLISLLWSAHLWGFYSYGRQRVDQDLNIPDIWADLSYLKPVIYPEKGNLSPALLYLCGWDPLQ